jgi:CxxC motif-containing protein (DUF1111 family)
LGYPDEVGPRITMALCVLAACGDNDPGEEQQGGDTTFDDRSELAFLHPAANLGSADRMTFQGGVGPFDFQWEIPPLGPLYNNDSCFGCHHGNGRGRSQIGADGARIDINGPQSEALVRVSQYQGDLGDPGGPIPVPGFGTQLQDHATVGAPEVFVQLTWRELPDTYPDGSPISLREPQLQIMTLNGPLPAGTLTSYRTAPAMIGLGLLEAIDDATIDALADPDDADGDGISGRVNHVWDPIGKATVPGRFGWKANTPSLRVQAAGAAANDIGLSSYIFPDPDGMRDLQDEALDMMTFMVSTIAVPRAAPRDPAATRGRVLFDTFQCSRCHVPTLETGDSSISALAHQRIHPYTDLLLHDMGDLLTDERPDFEATGREWRTPALWGIGLAQVIRPTVTFLHDGRARTFEEAILWHGGEAQAAHDAFVHASSADRDALLAFLSTL